MVDTVRTIMSHASWPEQGPTVCIREEDHRLQEGFEWKRAVLLDSTFGCEFLVMRVSDLLRHEYVRHIYGHWNPVTRRLW